MATTTQSSPNIPIFPVLLVNFIGMLGYSIIMPFLVFLVERFGGNAVVYGIVGAIYPSFQLVGAPLLGRWSDSLGRKIILLLSQIGTFIAWIIFIIALYLPLETIFELETEGLGTLTFTLPLLILMIARALDGLTGGNISVANAYMADISTEKNRKANFGKMAMSANLGFIIGPAVAGVLGTTMYPELLSVIAAAVVSLVAIYLIAYHLPESRSDLVDPDTKHF